MTEETILKRIRLICRTLPDTDEVVTWGHPTFRAFGKAFAVLETYQGNLSLALKMEKQHQELFLKDQRFYRTPYSGKHGWVSLIMDQGRIHWTEVRELLRNARGLVPASKAKARSRG